MPVLSRVLGVATIAFGALEFAKPDLWAKPTGITGPVARDAHVAPDPGRPRRASPAWRWRSPPPAPRCARPPSSGSSPTPPTPSPSGSTRPDARLKAKAVGAALGYAALNALSLRWAGK